MSKTAKAKKFPLLVYHQYHQVHSGLSKILIAYGIVLAVSAVLLWFFRRRLIGDHVWLLLGFGAAFFGLGLARYLATWFISRIPYVQCTPRNVKIQTTLVPIVFSYKRIQATRPTELREFFPSNRQKGTGRRMLEGHWGETVIVVELNGYPMSKSILRFLTGPFLLTPRGTGFVFLVKDWMGLNRQLADGLDQWRRRTSAPSAQRGYDANR